MKLERAFGLVDAERGFMPGEEGTRLGLNGFGELGVPRGEEIVDPTNRILGTYALHGYGIFTTQDWHPHETAHFSDNPDYQNTWPRHCVGGTPGAELHPNIILPPNHVRFIKGFDAMEEGEEDISYTGFFAEDPTTGHKLPEWIQSRGIKEVLLGGLALDYCVGLTAIDLRTKLGIDVIVAVDATRSITDESAQAMLKKFDEAGVRTTTTDEWLEALPQAA